MPAGIALSEGEPCFYQFDLGIFRLSGVFLQPGKTPVKDGRGDLELELFYYKDFGQSAFCSLDFSFGSPKSGNPPKEDALKEEEAPPTMKDGTFVGQLEAEVYKCIQSRENGH